MTNRERELAAIARLRPRALDGDPIAVSNIGAGYRILGRRTLAFRWWKRAADAGDGSDMLEVAYCYNHGLGVRRDEGAAARYYEAAIRNDNISQLEQEEAMYHLAILLMEKRGNGAVRRRAVNLLREANADGDYPQAAELLASMDTPEFEPCTCRRSLRPALARIACSLHRPKLSNMRLKGTATS